MKKEWKIKKILYALSNFNKVQNVYMGLYIYTMGDCVGIYDMQWMMFDPVISRKETIREMGSEGGGVKIMVWGQITGIRRAHNK